MERRGVFSDGCVSKNGVRVGWERRLEIEFVLDEVVEFLGEFGIGVGAEFAGR